MSMVMCMMVLFGSFFVQISIESYLFPLIEELNTMYHNELPVLTPQGTVQLANECDILAFREACGFLEPHARLGCNKCYK